VTFLDLREVFLPCGWLTPVSPGTAYTTNGGAVANDVHGKAHEVAGGFGDHVRWLELLLPSGEIVRASPTERPDLFAATIGGIGLTGIVLAVCLRLMRVPSNAVTLTERRMRDLDAFLHAFAETRAEAAYSVGWIDGLARGGALGRGILETAAPAETPVDDGVPRRRGPTVPVDLPGFALNGLTVAAFNGLYWRRVPPGSGRERRVAYGRFLYPLDALRAWNRIYGRRGFRQFQCVVPHADGERALRRMLEEIGRSGGASFLAVLKALGRPGRGHLSFPMEGYTLALDFPIRAGTDELFARLERATLDHGGRIYLAKDSRLSPAGFAVMYPRLDEFRAVLDRVDPAGRMRSDMARRLGIRGEERRP
jgi:decaprenylphospho-beta-D-ribofuranose 2-oxidase